MPFRHPSESTLEIREHGPILLGVLLLAFAPCVAGVMPGEIDFPAALRVPCANLLAVLGGACLLSYSRQRLDRQDGWVSSTWCLLVPWRTRRWRLDSFAHISVQREVAGQGSQRSITYPVRLEGEAPVLWKTCRTLAGARRVAGALAGTAGLPVHDVSVPAGESTLPRAGVGSR